MAVHAGGPLGLFGFVSHGGPQLVIVLLSLEKDEENPSHLNLLGAKLIIPIHNLVASRY